MPDNFMVRYKGKTKEKTLDIPGANLHTTLAQYAGIMQSLLVSGDKSPRNYLLVFFTVIISDRAHHKNGDHHRTSVQFGFKLPKQEIITGSEITTDGAETGYHTEQMFYKFMRNKEGQAWFLKTFKAAERSSVDKQQLQSIDQDGTARKVYGVVVDMHSRWSMCTEKNRREFMNQSCTAATLNEIKYGENGTLRHNFTQTLFQSGYKVSGIKHDGTTKEGKIGLKVAVRVGYESSHYNSGVQSNCQLAMNHPDNRDGVVISRRVKVAATKAGDFKNLDVDYTLLKSSTQSGLLGAIEVAADKADKLKDYERIDGLVRAFPYQSLGFALSNSAIAHQLADAYIRTGQCMSKDGDNVPLVAQRSANTPSLLRQVIDNGDRAQYDSIIELGSFTEDGILAATGFNDIIEIDTKLNLVQIESGVAKLMVK